MFKKAPSIKFDPRELHTLPLSAIRSEILILYDRWSRADSGGFLKALRAMIGVHEEIELVKNFRKIFGLPFQSLCFSEDILIRCVSSLQKKMEKHRSDAERALRSLETTSNQTLQMEKKLSESFVPDEILHYFEGMHAAMNELLSLRQTALHKISGLKSFSTQFDDVQHVLLLVSETDSEFIHSRATRCHGNQDLSVPTEFSSVISSGGRDLFSPALIDS